VPPDQVLFEMERLAAGLGEDDLDPLHPLDHPVEPEPRVATAEIRPDAGAERRRFSHVKDGVLGIAKEVDARLGREALELCFDAVSTGAAGGRRHAPSVPMPRRCAGRARLPADARARPVEPRTSRVTRGALCVPEP
jgi:hypothetical protein